MPSESTESEESGASIDFSRILLVDCNTLTLVYDDADFEITFRDDSIKISRDSANHVVIALVNQQVSYKATILGGFAFNEKRTGEIDYLKYFFIEWDDPMSIPILHFRLKPREISRIYSQNQKIEIGIEEIRRYHVVYRDGVEAEFERGDKGGFCFSFSTGFYGSFWREPDGAFSMTFKGDKLKPGEDGYDSQSKFIVTRSKYTGNLLLILQDDATVNLG